MASRCPHHLAMIVAALFAGAFAIPASAQSPPSPPNPYVQTNRAMSLERVECFLDTAAFRSAARRTRVTLGVQFAEHTINGQRVRHRTYNGTLVGPTIRTRPGDTVEIFLENRLVEPSGGQDQGTQAFHDFNVTNLHTHGLHVSPSGEGDNVFLAIAPGEAFQYRIKIPKNHPPGTFWYHPHRHGSTAFQVANGMAGALIVEGGLDDAPLLRGVAEKIMVFQQFVFRPQSGGVPAEVLPDDVYKPVADIQPVTAINGQVTPEIVMRPGEIQRWRMIHAGISRTMNLNLEGHKLHEIAIDGLTTGAVRARSQVELQPGYRADVLVQASHQLGTYLLKTEVTEKRAAVRALTVPATYVAKVVVQGEPVSMQLPAGSDLAAYRPAELRPVEDAEVKRYRDFTMVGSEGEDSPIYQINGASFDPTVFDPVIPLGSVEEWTLTAEVGGHPFHPHVNAFEVMSRDPETGALERVWRDTVFVRPGQTLKVRTRITDYTGRTVLHCHLLDHEDKGMMRAFEIVQPGKETRTTPAPASAVAPSNPNDGNGGKPVSPPQPAPTWALIDAYGRQVRFADYKGRPLVLVLHLGLGCPHCERQLLELGRREWEFRQSGVALVAISPRPTARAMAEEYRKDRGLALPLLADPDLIVFKALGCLRDGRVPLHGTFLIDSEGRVHWRSVGREPETDIGRILTETRRLAAGPDRR